MREVKTVRWLSRGRSRTFAAALAASALFPLARSRPAAAQPTVSITAPAAGALLTSTVTLSAQADSPAGIAGVQFRLDGADLGGRVNAAPYALSWNTAQFLGNAHLLTAVAWDASGSSATSAAVPVTVDNTPPAVVIMNPAAGASVSSTVMVSANATDNVGVAAVQFMLDGSELAPPVTAAPFLLPWNTALVADGPHTLGAIARDAAGNAATAVVSVTVSNMPPVIGSPSVGAATPNRADILWTTDQRSDSAAEYGPTPAYGNSTAVTAAQSTGHGVSLTGLAPGMLYHYRVKSRNAAGVLSVSGDFTFSTPGTPADGAAAGPATTDDSSTKAPQKFLSPATADGINDKAVFGPLAREVSIFDLRGKLVFHGTSTGPGSPVVWSCRDGAGRVVPSGVYLAKILTRDSRQIYQSFAVAK